MSRVMNDKFKLFILNCYDEYKHRRHILQIGGCKAYNYNFIGRIYSGNISPCFNDIDNIYEFLLNYNIDMLLLSSTLNHEEIEIYKNDFKDFMIDYDNNKIIIEFNNCKQKEFNLEEI